MRAIAITGAAVVLIVLGFGVLRHGDVWGAITYASLLFLLLFGEDIFCRRPAAPPEPDALDPWRPFPPSLGDDGIPF